MKYTPSKKNHFQFTRSEKRGIFVFFILILFSFAIRIGFSHFSKPYESVNSKEFEKQITLFEKSIVLNQDEYATQKLINNKEPFQKKEAVIFNFNPNTISIQQLILLGFSDKQAQTIDHYRKKGGRFKKKEDFKKIYSVSPEMYEKLAPHIILNEHSQVQDLHPNIELRKNPSSFTVELNKTDSTHLLSIKGIGPVFSSRIIAYREKLGGFYDLNQLLEIKGIKKELIEQIKESVSIDTHLIKKHNINTVTVDELKRHPYLNYYQAKAIIEYRKNVNFFDEIDELKNVNLIYEETYIKIKPYLFVR